MQTKKINNTILKRAYHFFNGIGIKNPRAFKKHSLNNYYLSSGIIIVVCILNFTCLAQTEQKTFKEGFNDNQLGWPISEGYAEDGMNASIQEGHYLLHSGKSGGSYLMGLPISIDDHKDFIFRAKIELLSINHGERFGLIWQSGEGQYQNEFVLSPKGFKVARYTKQKAFNLKPWTSSPQVYEGNAVYLLEAAQQNGRWQFSINGRQVFDTLAQIAQGNHFGFVLGKGVHIKIDFLSLTYQEPTINLSKKPPFISRKALQNINTADSDKAPLISYDGQTLYFCRRYLPPTTSEYTEKAWYATRNPTDAWSKPTDMGKPINNGNRSFIISVSPDNQSLLVGNTYNEDGTYKGNGVSISHRNTTGWEIPKAVEIDNYYNDHEYVNFFLAPNRQVLLMAVEQLDTRGSQDLYVSFLQESGRWSKPLNMGSTLNTHQAEFSPFLAADGKTLYFASEGHAGYGSADIFVSKRLDDTWQNWSKPLNLGPTVNTPLWDAYFTIDAQRQEAYIVSNYQSIGELDIFKLEVSTPIVAQDPSSPEKVVWVKGVVLDEHSKQAIGAQVFYEDLATGALAGEARSNPDNGTYQLLLPYGKTYGVRANASNYISVNQHFDLKTNDSLATEIIQNLYLSPLKKGERVPINNLFFARATADILPSSYPELNRLVDLMRKQSSLTIKIEGHTDGIGPVKTLMSLSVARAQAVKGYLISKGISPSRISEKGYGPHRPIAPNDTEENRRKNRRVAFVVVKV